MISSWISRLPLLKSCWLASVWVSMHPNHEEGAQCCSEEPQAQNCMGWWFQLGLWVWMTDGVPELCMHDVLLKATHTKSSMQLHPCSVRAFKKHTQHKPRNPQTQTNTDKHTHTHTNTNTHTHTHTHTPHADTHTHVHIQLTHTHMCTLLTHTHKQPNTHCKNPYPIPCKHPIFQ